MDNKKASSSALKRLNSLGQSIWYDNLSRDLLISGELKALIDQGVTGLTSNPTIFKAAIADTAHYDRAVRESGSKGLSAAEVVDELMVQDVGGAADLLAQVYDRTNKLDGYASIEVSPLLASDSAASISAAIDLWQRLNRPNVMVKIPATPAGLPAIEELLYQGINVNVTLIFSVETYQEVARAYINALSRRFDEGKPIDNIASVASFFVSRVDTIVDKNVLLLRDESVLDESTWTYYRENGYGRTGIENSIKAYQSFREIFSESEFQRLKKVGGAHVQRPLWASTGVKNKDFDPLLYVKSLVFPQTVNTVPPVTLLQLMAADSALFNSESLSSKPLRSLEALSAMNVNLVDLLKQLQLEGVESFAASYNDLICSVAEKIKAVS